MLTYINGKFVEETKAVISVNDRSFKYGDGLFETIKVVDGIPCFIEDHIKRLLVGTKTLKFKSAPKAAIIHKAARNLIKKNKITNGVLRINLTRGEDSTGYLATSAKPNLIIQTSKVIATKQSSAKLCIASFKQIPLTSLPVNLKLNNSLNYVMARIEAAENDCDDAIILDTNNLISETSSSNIFWVKNRQLYTPPLSTGCLDGITRKQIIKLTKAIEKKIKVNELLNADEIFITNSIKGIIRVTKIITHSKAWKNFTQTEIIAKKLTQEINTYVKKAKTKLG